MTFYALTSLVNAIIGFGLGIFVFLKNKKSLVNKTFFFFCLAITFWASSYFLWQISNSASQALFWSRILMIGAIFIPISYLHFLFALTGKTNSKKKLLSAGYLIFSFFFFANFTPLFVKNVSPKLGFPFWPNPGSLYHPFLAIWIACAIYSIYFLIKEIASSIGVNKAQLNYILAGTAIGYIGGLTNYFLWYDLPIPPIGNWTTSLYLAIVVYAVVKYRFMDIRFAIGKGVINIFSFITVVLISTLIVSFNNLSGQIMPPTLLISLILLIGILLFELISRLLKNIASKYFYYAFYSYQTVLNNLGKKLTQVLNLDDLAALIINTLLETMKLDKTVLLLRNAETGNYRIKKNIGFKEENGISLVKDNFLTRYLEKTKIPLVYEELSFIIKDNRNEKGGFEVLRQNMKRIEASVCLPLLIEEKIIGVIVLGNKISGDSYSKEDLDLLGSLANQASIALQNAKLYSQVEDLSKNLQQKVDEQTKELKLAYEDLKKLDQAKSEFVSIASHQLRTPLSAIKGYLSMILEGTYGTVAEKAKLTMEKIFQANERLIRLVNGLLNLSKIESGKIELQKEKTALDELIVVVLEILKIEAQNKGLYLKLEKPEKHISRLIIDKEKISQAILNIVDNAIHYTEKGGITIKINPKAENRIMIEIKDTGLGMDKEEIKEIFTSFSRGKAAAECWTEGAGLGLYVAKKFVEMHHGKIWAESAGPDKGSTFYIELPVGEDY